MTDSPPLNGQMTAPPGGEEGGRGGARRGKGGKADGVKEAEGGL